MSGHHENQPFSLSVCDFIVETGAKPQHAHFATRNALVGQRATTRNILERNVRIQPNSPSCTHYTLPWPLPASPLPHRPPPLHIFQSHTDLSPVGPAMCNEYYRQDSYTTNIEQVLPLPKRKTMAFCIYSHFLP